MKKVLAVFLAAVMMISTLGIIGFAGSEKTGYSFYHEEKTYLLSDGKTTVASDPRYSVYELSKNYMDANGRTPTILIFDTGSVSIGTVPQGAIYKLTDGIYTGCYALLIPAAFPINYVQLPFTSNAGDGQVANWQVLTAFNDPTVPNKVIQGDLFQIPKAMGDEVTEGSGIYRNSVGSTDNFIVFRAVTTANETTPVINKIFTVFYKIIKVLISDDLANQFYKVLKELGIDLDVDLTA